MDWRTCNATPKQNARCCCYEWRSSPQRPEESLQKQSTVMKVFGCLNLGLQGLRQRGLTRWNTLIVEDSPSNCLRNYGNAIYVRPFDILSQQRDEELHYLKTYFQRTLHGCANVRQVDKQSWRQEIENEEKSSKQPQAKNSESVAFWMTDSWKSNLIDLATRSLKL